MSTMTIEKDKLVPLVLAGFLLAAGVPMAYGEIVGSGTVETSTEQAFAGTTSTKLTVIDGTLDIAAVSITVDIPLENITSLSFYQNGTAPFGANVILGIDADNDGIYAADDLAWHIGITQHDASVLGGDSFIAMDGVPAGGAWQQVDAFAVSQWWTPNAAGDGFSFIDGNCYSTLQNLIENCADSRIDAIDHVKVVRLLIGGASSWNNLELFVDDLEVNGIVEDFEPEDTSAVVIQRVTSEMSQTIIMEYPTSAETGELVIPDENFSGRQLNGDPSLKIAQYSTIYDLTRDNPRSVIFLMIAAEKAGIDWNELTELQKCQLYLKLYLGV